MLIMDQDVIMSVLEASATRRDAKGYLQKYAPQNSQCLSAVSSFNGHCLQKYDEVEVPFNIAIINLRSPQLLCHGTLCGIAKTLTQLRALGLMSIIVVDCGIEESRTLFQDQGIRLSEAIDCYGSPGAKLAENLLTKHSLSKTASPSIIPDLMRVENGKIVLRALHLGMMIVVPSLARLDDISPPQPVEAHGTILTLTKYLTGRHFDNTPEGDSSYDASTSKPRRRISVERIILLDKLGGTPMHDRPGICHRFINLEQEYDALVSALIGPKNEVLSGQIQAGTIHAANLRLAKEALSLLSPASSALITTPFAAANSAPTTVSSPASEGDDLWVGFKGMVTTRRKHNPLLHNLLTDKPSFSPSLPLHISQQGELGLLNIDEPPASTLVKRGLPLSIYPDPKTKPWNPPKLGSPCFRLTDKCIDLPRLINLIEDSFSRRLDIEDYLNRVSESLAGIIVAGEYEGCAILTWERATPMNNQCAYDQEQFVPYLDKFAVLKSRQGSGGVADIIFNAMVRDCFPSGVCWRSRKDNPVNKWYFERAVGSCKLPNSNWTMFWTTLGLDGRHPVLRGYEAVCREVKPSWIDN